MVCVDPVQKTTRAQKTTMLIARLLRHVVSAPTLAHHPNCSIIITSRVPKVPISAYPRRIGALLLQLPLVPLRLVTSAALQGPLPSLCTLARSRYPTINEPDHSPAHTPLLYRVFEPSRDLLSICMHFNLFFFCPSTLFLVVVVMMMMAELLTLTTPPQTSLETRLHPIRSTVYAERRQRIVFLRLRSRECVAGSV